MAPSYDDIIQVLRLGDVQQLELLRQRIPGFPHGVDDLIGRAWITNAIDVGSLAGIKWMLDQQVDLNFRDDEGYTPLHAALERTHDDRQVILGMLLKAGAPVNRKGINDYTPCHLAAAQDDVASLRLLVGHGADLSLRTDIDHYATPLEEARMLAKTAAAKYLAGLVQ